MLTLNLARALAGIGGGGLQTMSTVILSDLIPFHKRGIYQAINNLIMGVGATLGASLGGIIADNLGWRWAFFLQLPFAVFGILVGFLFISGPTLRRMVVDWDRLIIWGRDCWSLD